MAKKVISTYKYASRFGSDASMVVSETDDVVVCEDEFGTYQTNKFYIQNDVADPNRTSEKRLGKLFGGKKGE